jgi:hypothetical protein
MVGGEIATHPDVMGAHIKGHGGVCGHYLLQLMDHLQGVHRHAAKLAPSATVIAQSAPSSRRSAG